MRIIFLGTGDIGVPTLEMLLGSPEHQVLAAVTQPDKPAGRRLELRASAIKTTALAHGLEVLQPAKIREPSVIERLRGFGAELIVVMAYGQILPRAILDLPSAACLNLHASLLPRHRGAAPIQAAIESGDRETGITVMHMAEGLDTGDILLKKALPIGDAETGGSLHHRLALLAPRALAEALTLLAEGRAPRIPQDENAATYAGRLKREDGQICWTRPALEIARKIRALNPWPSAYTLLPSAEAPRKLKIFSAALLPAAAGSPGEVLRADDEGIVVAADGGSLLLGEVQLDGKRRMAAPDFLRGHPLLPGTVLISNP